MNEDAIFRDYTNLNPPLVKSLEAAIAFAMQQGLDFPTEPRSSVPQRSLAACFETLHRPHQARYYRHI